jgi:cytochrome c oxidase assembly protein subunit 15
VLLTSVLVRSRLARVTFWLGIVTAVGMFIVLIMGATVTTTGSEHGCGRSWPLCHGQFIPEFAVSTFIEFSHRLVVAAESVLVIVFAAALLLLYGRRWTARGLAALMVGFLFIQAGMGAWAVMEPQSAAVLALHFGISLIAVASTALGAAYAARPMEIEAAPAVAGRLVVATWGMAAYLYLLVYSGAFIDHTGFGPACPGWPLCAPAGTWPPEATAVNLLHRSAAALAFFLAGGLLLAYRRWAAGRVDLTVGGILLLAAIAAQGAAGAYLVLSRWDLFGELTHDAVTGLIFVPLAYLCLRVSVRRSPESVLAGTPVRLRTESTGSA